MLLFRGPHWDKGLTPDQLQRAMDKVMAWFEGLNEGGKIKSAQPLGAQGRIISGTNGRCVEVRPILAECPIFQRHPDLVQRARERAVQAEQLWVAAAA